ncbi:MAG: histidinol dehydrogenase [Betaproteobacteria bacterium]|nr:MAG: histidinol dehydrogenase [Betaproteobacteria bacterium]
MTDLARLDSSAFDFDAALARLTAFESKEDVAIEAAVAAIVADVRARGDAAVLEYTARFDRVQARSVAALELPAEELAAAYAALPAAERAALTTAATRIRAYHERQRTESCSRSWEMREADGTRLGQKVTALARVGLYVPGGKAAYPSTVLMNALPARIAGVADIVMTVPTPDGVKHALLLAAAHLAGVTRAFAIGGAQAIAALAYGTATIPAVDKIVGPGNAYVAAAKRRVFGTVGIDMIAGPSEILVIADASANPDWVAMDLFAQAEHDEAARAILLSADAALLDAVAASIARALPAMPRRDIIAQALARHGALIRVRDLDEACTIADRIAPEHLELAVADPEALLPKLSNAGAIFLGHHSSEAIGDYCAGPNHVLPTARSARFSSPLGVYDFQKRSSVIGVSEAAAQILGRTAMTLARGEGLTAHARSAEYRLRSLSE